MELPIEQLLEKYWNGETTIAEERTIKEYFKKNPSITGTGHYFSDLNKAKQEAPDSRFVHPVLAGNNSNWYSAVAAAIMLGIVVTAFFFTQNNTKQTQFAVDDPKEAYEVTRQALMMVSEGLNKGKTYSYELEKFNEVKKIIKN